MAPIHKESLLSLQNSKVINQQKNSMSVNCNVPTPRLSKSAKKAPLKVSAVVSSMVPSRAPVCVRFSVMAQDMKGDIYLIMNTVPQAVDRDGMETIQLQKRCVCGWRMMKENDMCWSRMLTVNVGISKRWIEK